MSVTRKKFLSFFAKYNYWDLRVTKYYSATLGSQNISRNVFYEVKNQNESSVEWREKNKILDSILSSEISVYINKSSISLLKSYINFKCNAHIKYSFVVNSEVSKDIVDKILPELKEEKSFVVEGNPGLGLITLNLIKAQLPKIQIYENTKLKSISLEQLLGRYPDQLEIKYGNIFLPKGNEVVPLLENAVKLNVHNKIIGVVQQSQFFTNLIRECINCSLWNGIKVTDFFLIIPKRIWKNVVQNTESRLRYLTYCLFNLIFKTELLAEYPSSAFLPYSTVYKEEKMFFVKICKRPNFPGELKEKDVKLLLNLCSVLGRSKFNYIIQTLEQWIPECGPYLISKGISVTNQINDLSYDEFLKLYLYLKRIKGFKNFEIID